MVPARTGRNLSPRNPSTLKDSVARGAPGGDGAGPSGQRAIIGRFEAVGAHPSEKRAVDRQSENLSQWRAQQAEDHRACNQEAEQDGADRRTFNRAQQCHPRERNDGRQR